MDFIKNVVDEIIADAAQLSKIKIVLPNRRAILFFKREFSKRFQKASWLPALVTVEDLIAELSGLNIAQNTDILFEFYELYKNQKRSLGLEPEPFDKFSSWAYTLLSDFNDIDSYKIDAQQIFNHLSDIEKIENWSPELNETELIKNNSFFWKHAALYYDGLHKCLKENGMAYRGMAARVASENVKSYDGGEKLVFAGFNALTTSEEEIMLYFIQNCGALCFFDADRFYADNPRHEAGLSLRKIIAEQKLFKGNFKWLENDLSKRKNVKIYGAAGSVAQAILAGEIIAGSAYYDEKKAVRTALVLADEDLLIPMLGSLPTQLQTVNVTMGYPLSRCTYPALFTAIINLHSKTKKQGHSDFHFSDVFAVLSQNTFRKFLQQNKYDNAAKIIAGAIKQKCTRLSYGDFPEDSKNEVLEKIFDRPLETGKQLNGLLLFLISELRKQERLPPVELEQLFKLYRLLRQLGTYIEKYDALNDTGVYAGYFRLLLENEKLDFVGEPLSGMQLMGVLETRLLCFENIIITGLNEGILPKGRRENSLIPYDVKRLYRLPTFEDNDALYAYHFYRLLEGAKNIHLIYNSEKDELGSGEESRFIQQIRSEMQGLWNIEEPVLTVSMGPSGFAPVNSVKKTQTAIQIIGDMLKCGISPSAIITYLRDPLEFYYRRVLNIREAPKMEEDIDAASFGNVLHETISELYGPYALNGTLTAADCGNMLAALDEKLSEAFARYFGGRKTGSGKDFIKFKVMKRSMENYLEAQKHRAEEARIEIIALEQDLEVRKVFDGIGFPVKLHGKADLVQRLNGRLQLMDYKSGKVEAKDLELASWDELREKPKAFQLLFYALLYFGQNNGKNSIEEPFECAVIALKKYRQKPFTLSIAGKTEFTKDDLTEFESRLGGIFKDMLDPDVHFIKNTEDISYYEI